MQTLLQKALDNCIFRKTIRTKTKPQLTESQIKTYNYVAHLKKVRDDRMRLTR